jgi:hypothetical protein
MSALVSATPSGAIPPLVGDVVAPRHLPLSMLQVKTLVFWTRRWQRCCVVTFLEAPPWSYGMLVFNMSALVQSWCLFCSWRVVAVVPPPCALLWRFVPVHGDAAHLGAVLAERRDRGRRGAILRRCRCCGGLGFVPTRACLTASPPPVTDTGFNRGRGRRPSHNPGC